MTAPTEKNPAAIETAGLEIAIQRQPLTGDAQESAKITTAAGAVEKAAPIPADVLDAAAAEVLDILNREAILFPICAKSKRLAARVARAAIMQDRDDRASQEERIREEERAEAWEQREAALMDCQYVAGAQAGWNCAQADNPNEAFAALIKSRDGRIAALKQARARLRGDAS